MNNLLKNPVLILVAIFLFSACAAQVDQRGADKMHEKMDSVEYINSYNQVWDAALTSASELNWKIDKADKSSGVIKFKESYIYSPTSQKYSRIYILPTEAQKSNSNVAPYLLKVGNIDESKTLPFVKESLTLKIDEVSTSRTGVDIDYGITVIDSGGYNEVDSRGTFETKLYSRIERILSGIEETKTVISHSTLSSGVILYDVFFDLDSYNLTEDAKSVLVKNAQIIKSDPELNVVIFSYADTRGDSPYNRQLAANRSHTTERFLVSQGISHKRLITLSRGETNKFAYGFSEDDYQLNRRSHLIAVKATAPPLVIK